MTANDKDPLFRQTLRKMREDASHPLYRSLRDRTDPDYKMSMRAFRLLNRLAEGVTPEPDLPPLREDEIVQAAFRKDHFEAVGNKNHPLNPASFEMAGAARKESAREEMRHVMALGYRDSFPADAVTRAQEYFQAGFPERIKQKMETYRKAVSPLLDQPPSTTQARPSNQAQPPAKRPEPLYASLPPANQSIQSDAEAPRPLSSYRSLGEALFAGPPLPGNIDRSRIRIKPPATTVAPTDSISGSESQDSLIGAGGGTRFNFARAAGEAKAKLQDRFDRLDQRAADAVDAIRAMNESWRQSQDARTQFPDPKQRPSFSALDRPNDPETTKEMTDFYKSLDRHNLGHKINTIATGGFFIEGGRRYNKSKSAFAGLQKGAMQDVSNAIMKSKVDLRPAGAAPLPANIQQGLSSDQAADAYVIYIDKSLMNNINGGIRALDRFDDTVAATAFTHTLFERGPRGGPDLLADTVQRTLQEIAERGPKDQKFLRELAKTNDKMIPDRVEEGQGQDSGRRYTTYRDTKEANDGKQAMFDNFVMLANSPYRDLLLRTLARRRTLPKDNQFEINKFATDAPNQHNIVK